MVRSSLKMITLTRKMVVLASVTYSCKKIISLTKMYLEYKLSPIRCLTDVQANVLGVILDSFSSLISLKFIFIDFCLLYQHCISPEFL